MKKIVIIGAGDGGRVVSELLKQVGGFKVCGFIDDNLKLRGRNVDGYKVLGDSRDLGKFRGLGFLVSVGVDTGARGGLFYSAIKAGLRPITLIHKTAVVAGTARIGAGTIISANCVIGAFSKVGRNNFIFASTVLEHDSETADNVYFSPSVSLAGGVKVKEDTFFGINSCVIEEVRIGSNCIVGAGSVVLKDVPDYSVVAGVPAKLIGKKKNEAQG